MEIKAIPIAPEDFPVEDNDFITYVECEFFDPKSKDYLKIFVYAGSDGLLAHHYLLSMAEDEEIVPANASVLGGGHLDASTLKNKKISNAFGAVSSQDLEMFVEILRQ